MRMVGKLQQNIVELDLVRLVRDIKMERAGLLLVVFESGFSFNISIIEHPSKAFDGEMR